MAANQSMEAAERASKVTQVILVMMDEKKLNVQYSNADTLNQDVKEEDLVNRAEGLKDNSSRSQTEANKTQTDLTSV